MSDKAYLTIGKEQFQTAWYVGYELLMPFRPSDYDGTDKFSTNAKQARKNLASYGVTLENIEKKIAKIIRVDASSVRKFRETGQDDLSSSEEDSNSIGIRLEIFEEEDHPEIGQIYDILKALDKCSDDKEITLNLEEIHRMYHPEEWYKDANGIFQEAEENYKESLITINLLEDFKNVDVFINHDSSDKDNFVDELASKLRSKGLNVWYDKFEMQVGDSIHKKIQKGLQDCRYGIVVLSNSFMQNFGWAQEEFESLKAKERLYNKSLILPIWRTGITKKDVGKYNLELSERLALNESEGMDEIVDKLTYKIITDPSQRSPNPSEKSLHLTNTWVKDHMVGLSDNPEFTSTCIIALSENTKELLLDNLPPSINNHENIVVYTGGWAAKFIPLMGKILSDLVLNNSTPYNISNFKIKFSHVGE